MILIPFFEIAQKLDSFINVLLLGAFIARAEQKDNNIFDDRIIDTVSWTEIDYEFRNAVTTWPVFAEIAIFDAVNSFLDCTSGFYVAQIVKPILENVFAVAFVVNSLKYFCHGRILLLPKVQKDRDNHLHSSNDYGGKNAPASKLVRLFFLYVLFEIVKAFFVAVYGDS